MQASYIKKILYIGSLKLEMNSGGQHHACEELYAMSGGIADGKDLGIGLPR